MYFPSDLFSLAMFQKQFNCNLLITILENIIKDNYNSNFTWTEDTKSRNAMWHARHQIFYATQALKPDFKVFLQ